jgi:nucleoside 2-deoxyribosyltransferase
MKKITVYLAHPMSSKTEESEAWKREFYKQALEYTNELDVCIIDPCDLRLRDGRDDEKIVKENKNAIARSDVVVAHATVPSAGVSMEIFYAWLIGIPVLTFCEREPVPAWIQVHSRRVFITIDHIWLEIERFTR